MNQILFETGDRVVCRPCCGERSGMEGIITGELAVREGFGINRGKPIEKVAYEVLWADLDRTPATQIALTFAKPRRGDMDTKVSWLDMPYPKRDEDLL